MQRSWARLGGLIRLSFRARLTLAFGVLLALLVCIALSAVAALTQGHRDARRLLDQTAYKLWLASDIKAQILLQGALVSRYLSATSDAEMAQIAALIDPAAAEFDRQLALLSQISSGPAADLLARLAALSRHGADLRVQALDLSRQNSNGRAAILSTNEMPGVRARVLTALDALAAQDPRSAVQLAATGIAADTNGIAADQKNALLTPEAGFILRHMAAAEQGRAQIARHLAQLHLLLPDPAQTARLDEAMRAFAALDARIEALIRANTNTHAADLQRGGLADVQAQMLDLVAGMSGLAQTELAHAADQAVGDVASARLALILMTDGALALGILMALALRSGLGQGLEEVATAAERLAEGTEDGALELNLSRIRGGTAGRIGVALSRLAAVQRDIVELAQRIASEDLSARRLRRCEGDALGLALETMVLALADAAADRTRSHVEARALASRLHAAVAAAKVDADQVVEGGMTVTAALDRLAEVAAQPETVPVQASDLLQHLRHDSQTAQSVLRTALQDLRPVLRPAAQLRSFAQKADVLSTSAAVEATRAGVHGLEFAIVAAELRHLADRSLNAAQASAAQVEALTASLRQVLTHIEALPAGVERAWTEMAQALRVARPGLPLAADCAQALRHQGLTRLRSLTALAQAEARAAELLALLPSMTGDTAAQTPPKTRPEADPPEDTRVFTSRRPQSGLSDPGAPAAAKVLAFSSRTRPAAVWL